MSTAEDRDEPVAAQDEAAEKRKLDLAVEISDVGPCKKHIKVAIARDEIDRQFKDSLKSVRREAAVPGFRPGRAPATLVSKRFRKEVEGQVKSTLLMAALEQIDSDYQVNPISQPNLDVEAIPLPDDGPMKFEMDVEVRPEFRVPAYKALAVKRPVREVTEADVDRQLQAFLERYGRLTPKLEGGAEAGDQVTADLRFHKDGATVNEVKEVSFRLQPELRFQDGSVPDLLGALQGAKPGEVREAEAKVGTSSADPALRGQSLGVTITVLDLKRLELPELDEVFLDSIGFESREELRTALREVIERRFRFRQRQEMRKQICDQLIAESPFDLPRDLVARQERTTIRNLVQEMRAAGLSDDQIRAREAEIRANAHETTLRSLKEFFLLTKIAEEEEVKVEESDIEDEIRAMSERTDETPRRIRARIEKEGLGESLATQILERKAIERILEYVKIEDVVETREETGVETLDESATPGGVQESPEDGAEAPAATEDSDA